MNVVVCFYMPTLACAAVGERPEGGVGGLDNTGPDDFFYQQQHQHEYPADSVVSAETGQSLELFLVSISMQSSMNPYFIGHVFSIPLPNRWKPFLNKAMSFKASLDQSINHKNNQHLQKNLRSANCLFVPLWVAAATKGSELRERLEIDAFGGLQRAGEFTALTMYETKNSTPGGWESAAESG